MYAFLWQRSNTERAVGPGSGTAWLSLIHRSARLLQHGVGMGGGRERLNSCASTNSFAPSTHDENYLSMFFRLRPNSVKRLCKLVWQHVFQMSLSILPNGFLPKEEMDGPLRHVFETSKLLKSWRLFRDSFFFRRRLAFFCPSPCNANPPSIHPSIFPSLHPPIHFNQACLLFANFTSVTPTLPLCQNAFFN